MNGVFKFIGVSIIISAGILSCIFIKSQLKKRSNLIDQLLSSMITLQNEISYGLNTLEESFLSLSSICGELIKDFYKKCAVSLSDIRVMQFYDIWQQHAEQLFSNILFAGKEKEVFISLGKTLGSGDIESQQRSIELVISQLKSIKEVTDLELKNKTKLAAGLSFIITAIIVLIYI